GRMRGPPSERAELRRLESRRPHLWWRQAFQLADAAPTGKSAATSLRTDLLLQPDCHLDRRLLPRAHQLSRPRDAARGVAGLVADLEAVRRAALVALLHGRFRGTGFDLFAQVLADGVHVAFEVLLAALDA